MSHITLSGSVTLDETDGLQNFTATPGIAGDANDNDIAFDDQSQGLLPLDFWNWINSAGTPLDVALSNYDGADSTLASTKLIDINGADLDLLKFSTDGTGTDFATYDPNNAPLDPSINGIDSLFTDLDGNSIYLFQWYNDPNILVGIDSEGNISLAIYLDQTLSGDGTNLQARIWTVQFEPLAHDDPTLTDEAIDLQDIVYLTAVDNLEFDASNSPSGQNLFIMFGTGDGNYDFGIVATGKEPINQSIDPSGITSGNTVNTSQAGGPTTFGIDNQMLTASAIPGEGDGIVFTYVTDTTETYTVPNLDQNEADIEANIAFGGVFSADTATFDVVQLQGGKTAVVKITAIDSSNISSGETYIDGQLADISGLGSTTTIVDIETLVITGTRGKKNSPDSVTFTIDSTAGLGTHTVSDGIYSIEVTFLADGTVTIDGLMAGDNITFTTDGDHNRVLIENAGDGSGQDSADFDIGGFQLLDISSETVEIGSLIEWEDDGPNIGLTAPEVVEEEQINNANSVGNEDFGSPLSDTDTAIDLNMVTQIAQLNYNAAITAGTDEQAIFSLDATGVTPPTLTSKGAVVNFDLDSAGSGPVTYTLTGTVISISGATGLALTDPIPADTYIIQNTVPGDDFSLTTSGSETLQDLIDAINAGTAATAALVGGILVIESLNGDDLYLEGFDSVAASLTDDTYDDTRDVLTWSVTDVGLATFTLLDQIDHVAGSGENLKLISFQDYLNVTDADLDPVTDLGDLGKYNVIDDVPIQSTDTSSGVVEEEEENVDGTGNEDSDGAGDDDTTDPDDFTITTHVATGNLNDDGVVLVGTDEVVGGGASFSLKDTVAALSTLPDLMSLGESVVYDIQGNTLYGYVEVGGTGGVYDDGTDRLVFTFALSGTNLADWTFTLVDQLDHVDDGGDDENTALIDGAGSVSNIDFSGVIDATDYDGDSITLDSGSVFVTAIDDVPIQSTDTSSGIVEEEEAAVDGAGNEDSDGAGDDDTVDPDDFTQTTNIATGNLNTAGVVDVGADELSDGNNDAAFSLKDTVAALSTLPDLMSLGESVVYDIQGNTLYGYVEVGGTGGVYDDGTDRLVFTFALSGTNLADWTFTLVDQLDHVDDGGDDENTALIDGAGSVSNIDFSGVIDATDYDGDSITLDSGSVFVTAIDDVPIQSTDTSSGIVEEEEAAVDGAGNEDSDGAGDDDTVDPDDFTQTTNIATGNLNTAGVVDVGADELSDGNNDAAFSLKDTVAALSTLPDLMSLGESVVYDIQGNTLYGYVEVGGTGGVYDDGTDRLVFTFALSGTNLADWTFTLVDQLDHVDDGGDDENTALIDGAGSVSNIDFSGVIDATDYDGDSITLDSGSVFVTAIDDVPIQSTDTSSGIVEEEEAAVDGAGNEDSDGAGDDDTVDPDDFTQTTNIATGNLNTAGVVDVGADELSDGNNDAAFSLKDTVAALSTLPDLMSLGESVVYDIQGNTLYGYVEVGGTGGVYDDGTDRLVFTFALSGTNLADWTFTLVDQLDHVDDGGDDENTALIDGAGSVSNIDFSGVIDATDYDGDSITLDSGSVFVTAIDDVPIQSTDTSSGIVEEEEAAVDGAGNEDSDGAGDDDTVDPDDFTQTTNIATGNLNTAGVVDVGADELSDGNNDAAFSLKDTVAALSTLPDLMSLGESVVYDIQGNTLYGYVEVGGTGGVYDDGTDRLVFTFALSGTNLADWTFTLVDQLDHVDDGGDDENTALIDGAGSVSNIDFSGVIDATDYDGDSITLDSGSVFVTAIDDVPIQSTDTSSGIVEEEEAAVDGAGNEDSDGAGDDDTVDPDDFTQTTNIATGNLNTAGVVDVGADELSDGNNDAAFSLKDTVAALSTLPDLMSLGESVVYDIQGNTLYGYVEVGGTGGVYDDGTDRLVFTFALSGTNLADWTFTLVDQLDHVDDGGDDENTALIDGAGSVSNIDFSGVIDATDYDGDSITLDSGSVTVTVIDDVPILEVGNIAGTGTSDPQIGEWVGLPGADEYKSLTITIDSITYGPSGGETVDGTDIPLSAPTVGPNGELIFTGSITGDFDGNEGNGDETLNFDLTFNPDGTYVFDLEQNFGSSFTFSSDDGALPAGGPDPVQTLPVGDDAIVFFALDPLAAGAAVYSGAIDGAPDEGALESAGLPFIGPLWLMNVSTSGIGVNNNNLQGDGIVAISSGDQSFVVNPETDLTQVKVYIDNSVAGYNTATEDLYYRVYFVDGSVSDYHLVESGDLTSEGGGQVSFTIDWEDYGATSMIDAVQLTMAIGKIKIPTIEFTQTTIIALDPITVDFQATLTDNDNDTATDAFSVDIGTDLDPLAPPDIVLDGTSDADAFNINLASGLTEWVINGFDGTDGGLINGDKIVLLNPLFDYVLTTDGAGDDTITIGGTTVTVANGADELTDADILVAYADTVIDGDILVGNVAGPNLTGTADADALIIKADLNDVTGGDGGDAFVFVDPENAVTSMTDFDSSEGDFLVFSTSGFGLSLDGPLSSDNFVSGDGAVAGDADDYFIFNTLNGDLSFDADGNGAGAAVVIANFGISAVTEGDIFLIA